MAVNSNGNLREALTFDDVLLKPGLSELLPSDADVRSRVTREIPLNIGFVGRAEQTGHPAQKPEKVIEPLILMTTKPGDTVLDPMCGSGTTGAVCRRLGRKAILCDLSEEYTGISERRLGIRRRQPPKYSLKNS